MISNHTLKRALERLKLIRYFPSASPECLEEVRDMMCELYDKDEYLERAMTAIFRDPEWAEWKGPGAFFHALKTAAFPYGLRNVNGRWIPDPRNGPEYDVIDADGKRHWWGTAYLDEKWKPTQMTDKPPRPGLYSLRGRPDMETLFLWKLEAHREQIEREKKEQLRKTAEIGVCPECNGGASESCRHCFGTGKFDPEAERRRAELQARPRARLVRSAL